MSRDSHRQLDRIRRHGARCGARARSSLSLSVSSWPSPSPLWFRQTWAQVRLTPAAPSLSVRPSASRLSCQSATYPAGPARLLGMAAFRPLFLVPLWHDFTFLCALFQRPVSTARPLALALCRPSPPPIRRRHWLSPRSALTASMPYSGAICLGRLSHLTAFLCLSPDAIVVLPELLETSQQYTKTRYRLCRLRSAFYSTILCASHPP